MQMRYIFVFAACTILLFTDNASLIAQNKPIRRTHPNFFFEFGYYSSVVLLGRASFLRVQAGKQATSGFSITWSATFILETLERNVIRWERVGGVDDKIPYDAKEKQSGTFYAGMRMEWLFLRNWLSPYIGASIVFGHYGFDEACWGGGPCNGYILIGLEPEFGLQTKLSDNFYIRTGWGTLGGLVIESGGGQPGHNFYLGLRWHPGR